MAYTAKCNTAAATKWWITGTGSVVNRLSEAMDDNGAGVEEADNPGNFQPWTSFMTEHVEDGLYQILLNFEIGDGATPTTLDSFNEFVWFDTGARPYIRNAATLNMGTTGGGGAPIRGSAWRWQNTSQMQDIAQPTSGVLNCYASMLQISPEANAEGPELAANMSATLERVIINQEGTNQWMDFSVTSTAASLKHVYFTEGRQTCAVKATPATFENVTSGDGAQCPYGIQAAVTLSGADWYDSGTYGIIDNYKGSGGYTVLVKDPAGSLAGDVQCRSDDNAKIYEQYTCNIHVVDAAGAAIQTATVVCEDQFGTEVFSVTTDASGDIAEQVINYKQWYGTSETLIDYSPHVFTISKAAYTTLEMEEITVDAPIVWHLELLPAVADPSLPSVTYNSFKKNIMNGAIDLDTDTIMCALVTSSYTPDIDAHEFFDDITDEVVGTGYTAGGAEITTKVVTQDNANDLGKFDGDNVAWAASTITARGAVIYKDTGTDATSPLMRYFDFGANKSTTGDQFKITWGATGILHSVDP